MDISKVAEAELPTRFGEFKIVAFKLGDQESIAVIKGDVSDRKDVPIRIHSSCITGDVLGSLRCDCREQLENALAYIEKNGCGAVIYLQQEGRGIGIANKIKAYALQESGLDTVDANKELGFDADLRDYSTAADIIKKLGIRSVVLLTNNPQKVDSLVKKGIACSQKSLKTEPNRHNREYLQTKKERMGHLL